MNQCNICTKDCKGHICSTCRSRKTNWCLKIKAINYKGGCCQKCGYNRCMRSLVFHHIDPKQKDFNIANSYQKKWTTVQAELDKCKLLCANCHNELHEEIDKNSSEYFLNRWNVYLANKMGNDAQIIDTRSYIDEIEKSFSSMEKYGKEQYDISKQELENLLENNTVAEICVKLNVGNPTIYHKMKKWNLKTKIKVSRNKINWPSKEELEKLVWEKSAMQIGKELGVSDKAVANKCKRYGIPRPGVGYWAKTKCSR